MAKLQAHADIEGLAFAAMRAMMLHEAAEHGLPVLENEPTRLKVESLYGAFGLEDRAPLLRLSVESDRADHLFTLRESLVGHIEHFLPEVAESITWSDAIDAGELPPNFQFGTVERAYELCQDFRRLTVKLSNPERFEDPSIHFRFALPPQGIKAPEWPRVQPNGGTRWPTGTAELHRPVYTARSFDAQAGTIDVDVFEHVGGRTTDWAKTVKPGEEVAIIGPGGGGILKEIEIVLAGDETAFPAMSRILEALPAGARADLFFLSHSGAKDYPIPERDGSSLTWVTVRDAQELADVALNQALNLSSPFLWFGAEKNGAAALRKDPRLSAVPKVKRYIAAYWSSSATS
ncbi:MAG: siderophore-interacting protein [Pseudomonadota bacterium]